MSAAAAGSHVKKRACASPPRAQGHPGPACRFIISFCSNVPACRELPAALKPALLTVASNVLLSLPAHAEAGKIFGERCSDCSGPRWARLRHWQACRNTAVGRTPGTGCAQVGVPSPCLLFPNTAFAPSLWQTST